MTEMGLSIADVMSMTGKARNTVWRYRTKGTCPPAVARLITQQKTIRSMAATLAQR